MFRRACLGSTGALCALLAGCGTLFPLPTDANDANLRLLLQARDVTPLPAPAPVDADRARLGQMLFFDKILSGNRNIACATCHHPRTFSADGLAVSIGQGGVGLAESRSAPRDANGEVILIPRNAPELFQRPSLDVMFWDGRVARTDNGFVSPAGAQLPATLFATPLEVQAMFPVTSREEMRGLPGDNEIADHDNTDFAGIWNSLMERLFAIEEYVQLFTAAFPNVATDDLHFAHAAIAIAEFERSIDASSASPFDRYLAGDDTALSPAAKRGAELFFDTADCARCHAGPLLTDQQFHNRCVPQVGPGKGDGDDGHWDFGRFRETGAPADMFAFRTPPLRNVALTAPYMHSGAFATLEAAVRHCANPLDSAANYDATQVFGPAGAFVQFEQMDTIIASADMNDLNPLSLTDDEIADLVAFLEALTDPTALDLPRIAIPERVPSGLPIAD